MTDACSYVSKPLSKGRTLSITSDNPQAVSSPHPLLTPKRGATVVIVFHYRVILPSLGLHINGITWYVSFV